MVDAKLLCVIAWAASGIVCLLRWQFTQPEVTLLDLALSIIVGAIFGPAIPIMWMLHSVKIKGGQHGAE